MGPNQGSQRFPGIKYHDIPWLLHHFSMIDVQQFNNSPAANGGQPLPMGLAPGLAYRWNFTDNRYADIDLSPPIYRPIVSADILALTNIYP